MAEDLETLARGFAGSQFRSSPLYQVLSNVVASDRELLELIADRRAGQQPTGLFFAAVQYLLLAGVDHELKEFYPSVVRQPRDPSTAGPVLQSFCRGHHDELAAILRTRLVQRNVVRRAAAVRLALWVIGREIDSPVHLVEIGASAGVHLRADRYRYAVAGKRSGPTTSPVVIDVDWLDDFAPPDLDDLPAVATATGVDLDPVDVANERDRLWLRALIWPENDDEAELLTAALGVVAADPPVVVAGDAIDVCPDLAEQLPAGEARLAFHFATRIHVPEDRLARFDAALDSLGSTGPLYHLWAEGHRHDPRIADFSPVLALQRPGAQEPSHLAAVDGYGRWIRPLDLPS